MGEDDDLKKELGNIITSFHQSLGALHGRCEALERALGAALLLLRDNPDAVEQIRSALDHGSKVIAADPGKGLGERDAYEVVRGRLLSGMEKDPEQSGRIGGGTVQ